MEWITVVTQESCGLLVTAVVLPRPQATPNFSACNIENLGDEATVLHVRRGLLMLVTSVSSGTVLHVRGLLKNLPMRPTYVQVVVQNNIIIHVHVQI